MEMLENTEELPIWKLQKRRKSRNYSFSHIHLTMFLILVLNYEDGIPKIPALQLVQKLGII